MKRTQTVPVSRWDSMAPYYHAIDLSGPPTSEYENWKHIINIEDESEDLETTKYWNIYEVPSNLRKLNEEAYTPQLVSIGPIHHGQGNLNRMQDQKLRYLKLFWGRLENKIKAMDRFKKFLENKEKEIRQCYAENLCVKMEKQKLVEMLMLDSVFIMELFLRVQKQKSEESVEKPTYSDDIILKQSWLNKSIQRDLLLLENQIPLFILEELYSFVSASDPAKEKHPTFVELARDYFDSYKQCDEETGSSDVNGGPLKNGTGGFEKKDSSGSIQLMLKNCRAYEKGDSCSSEETGSSDSRKGKPLSNGPKHFTDLIRNFYICKRLCHLSNFKKASPSRTATKLREAGVSFEKVVNKPLLDINFKRIRILSWFLCFGCIPHSSYFKARLQIPELKVEYTTECVLRNLIAFEQCHYPNEPYICNYVSFIDSLIHTKDDVELLVEKEVIVHELGSDKEVATLVNGLCKHVVVDKTCYEDLINDLNKHYQRQWNRTMAALRLVYFRDAWRASSTLVATAVLVFTIFNFWRVVRLVLDLEGGNKKQP